MSNFELYFLIFCVGFVGSAVLLYLRARKRYRNMKGELEDTEAVVGMTARSQPALEPAAPSRTTPLEQRAIAAEDIDLGGSGAGLVFSVGRSLRSERECPKCKRQFDETTVLCPYDATPLVPRGGRGGRRERVPDDTAPRPCCLECGRRYERSARFCYHDGQALTPAREGDFPVFHVCANCGHETTDPNASCGCDEPRKLTVSPADDGTVVMPTIPMMRCRRCNYLGMPGQRHCPNDGELLLPVMNVHVNALPPTGLGPRRKICEKCGRQFSGSASYCAYDGSKLETLN